MYGQEVRPTIQDHPLENVTVVDLRSDTLTKPTKEMREAISNAEVGDDVYQEDPTVKKLEKKAAEMVGMEAALFVTSGTMGNLIAIMNHCDVRGCEAYCGEVSHIFLHEQGGAAQIGNVTISPIPNNPDGTFSLETLKSKLRHGRDYEPISRLILVENTLNGIVLPDSWLKEVVAFAKEHSLKLHMDGARLWNASIASGKSGKELVQGFDSVSFCLSKGLGSPVGSLLCGTKEFIARARRIRKVLGGGMRQVGILAAAGLVSLEKIIPILKDDHRRAKTLAEHIHGIRSKVFTVNLELVHTNMVFIEVQGDSNITVKFVKRLQEVRTEKTEDMTIVKCCSFGSTRIRLVLNYDITDELLLAAMHKIEYVIKEMDANV